MVLTSFKFVYNFKNLSFSSSSQLIIQSAYRKLDIFFKQEPYLFKKALISKNFIFLKTFFHISYDRGPDKFLLTNNEQTTQKPMGLCLNTHKYV